MEHREAFWDKVSAKYGDEIISPKLHSLYNPLFDWIEELPKSAYSKALDLGCGTGPMLATLCQNYQKVCALDLSGSMLEQALNRVFVENPEDLLNIDFVQSPIHMCPQLGPFDLILAVNSLLMTELHVLKQAFRKLALNLRPGGTFIGVFPSLESIQESYQFQLTDLLKQNKSYQKAKKITDLRMQIRRLHAGVGAYNIGGLHQKYYTQYEIQNRLLSVQIEPLRFDKVIYKREHNYNYHDKLPHRAPKMWDWVVMGQKASPHGH